ncbi:unnamed protein product [Prorocentrum cordatum]|uniref:Protein xylosyltransferase n=1 Tax=Prorocentrum cordatum TaxID=2364126 RepID=A0ABN9PM28_9DINO|nr:unnamed protein product [Polarella glacialis]
MLRQSGLCRARVLLAQETSRAEWLNVAAIACAAADRLHISVDGWPSFKHFNRGPQHFIVAGVAGPLWVTSDPNLLSIIIRPYRDFIVDVACIWHDRPARLCDLVFTSEHNDIWFHTAGWVATWKAIERGAQTYLGLPPHRHLAFMAAHPGLNAQRASNGERVGPPFGLRP